MKFWAIRILSIALALGGCFALDLLCAQVLEPGERRLVVLAALYVTLAVSLNLINGITGQFSIGHAAFYQIGAYTAGYLSITFAKQAPIQGIPWLIAMVLVASLAAGLAGLLVGLPSLRLRGDYLAIVTLGFGEIIRIIVNNQPKLGSSYGLNITPKMNEPGFHMVAWASLLAVVCIAVCRNLLKTAHGLPFLAVREDEVASSAMGVNVTRVKVVAFVLGSAFAGAAGALLAHYEGFITPPTFGMDVSFIILTMVVLGGTGSITGSALAAMFLFYLPEWLRGLKQPGTDNALAVSAALVVGALIAIALATGITRRMIDSGWKTKPIRAAATVGIVAGAAALAAVLGWALGMIPALGKSMIEAGQLRMVIFAVVLVVIMLLRPQGVFAHHEFSWAWVMRLLGKKDEPKTEVWA